MDSSTLSCWVKLGCLLSLGLVVQWSTAQPVIPSRLLISPASTILSRGSNITVNCTADIELAVPISVLFKQVGSSSIQFLIPPLKRGFRLEDARQYSAIFITYFSEEQEGSFHCLYRTHESTLRSEVIDLSLAKPPRIVTKPANVAVNVSMPWQIVCESSGVPLPRLEIIRHGQVLKSAEASARLVMGKLTASLADAGDYLCRAKNSLGEDNHTVTVTVQTPPLIKLKPIGGHLHIAHSKTLQLQCEVTGLPEPHIVWMHNGTVVTDGITTSDNLQEAANYVSTLHISDLSLLQSGTYHCKATNLLGSSEQDIQISVQVPPSPPSHVRIDAVHARTIGISWLGPSFLGNSHILHYRVITYNTSFHRISAATVNEPRLLIGGLSPNTQYVFRVRAINTAGASHYSNYTQEVQTLPEVPLPPTNVMLKTATPTALLISWEAPVFDFHHGTLRKYSLRYHEAGSSSSVDTIFNISANLTTFNLTGLDKGTKYVVTVLSHNIAGASDATGTTEAFTKTTVPGAPQFLDPQQVTPVSLQLKWSAPVDNGGSAITQWHLFWNNTSKSLLRRQVSSGERSYTIHDLKPGVTYRFRLSAENNVGRGPSAHVSITTPQANAPLQPGSPVVIFRTSHSLLVKLPLVPNALAKHQKAAQFVLKYQVDGSNGRWTSGKVAILQKETCLTGLQANTSYNLRVAVLSGAMSPFSARVQTSTLPPGTAPQPDLALLDDRKTVRVSRPPCPAQEFMVQYRRHDSNVWHNTTSSNGQSRDHVLLEGLEHNTTYSIRLLVRTSSGAVELSSESTITTSFPPSTAESSSSSTVVTLVAAIIGSVVGIFSAFLLIVICHQKRCFREPTHITKRKGWVDQANNDEWYTERGQPRDDDGSLAPPLPKRIKKDFHDGFSSPTAAHHPVPRPEPKQIEYAELDLIQSSESSHIRGLQKSSTEYAQIDLKKTAVQHRVNKLEPAEDSATALPVDADLENSDV